MLRKGGMFLHSMLSPPDRYVLRLLEKPQANQVCSLVIDGCQNAKVFVCSNNHKCFN